MRKGRDSKAELKFESIMDELFPLIQSLKKSIGTLDANLADRAYLKENFSKLSDEISMDVKALNRPFRLLTKYLDRSDAFGNIDT